MVRIYIVGKVTGQENWKDKFIKAKKELEVYGYEIRTPIDYPEGLTQREYMVLSCENVFWASRVVVTPGFETSKGTAAEIALARSIGTEVQYIS